MANTYESVISEAQLNVLSLIVTRASFTLEAASAELCEDVIDAMCDDATDGEYYDEDDEVESALCYAEGKASAINNQGFDEQLRYLYDCNDMDIVTMLVRDVVANLKSK
jgi:hypothetical protein